MRCESTTFICDGPECSSRITSTSAGDVGVHLDLAEAGWLIDRRIIGGWKHYCGIECKQAREAK